MSIVRRSPDLLPRKVEPEEIGDGCNAVVYPRNCRLGEIPDILKDYEGAGLYSKLGRKWTSGRTQSLFIENLDLETMVKLENSPDVALTYYTSSEKFRELKHKDVNLLGAGTQATIYPRDQDKPGEILDIIKDYEDAGKVKFYENFIGDWRRCHYIVDGLDLDTLLKLQNSPDVNQAYYSIFGSFGAAIYKCRVGDEPGKPLRRKVKKNKEEVSEAPDDKLAGDNKVPIELIAPKKAE